MLNFLDFIKGRYEYFSPKEKKIADVVLEKPQKVIASSIAQLAKSAGVSEPTVHRFCQKINTEGYPDFKLKLAQTLAKGIPYVNIHVDENDSTENYTRKIFDSEISILNETRKNADIRVIQRCVDVLSCARRITFCGVGASATVAHDMLNKFFRFNIPCNYFEDPVMMLMSASNCSLEDVFVMISHTGRTKNLVEVARYARNRRATVIGITAENSPLAEECSLVLSTKIPEDTDVYIPMASRLAQLALVDVLATGLFLRKGPQFVSNLKNVKEAVRESRFELKSDRPAPAPAADGGGKS